MQRCACQCAGCFNQHLFMLWQRGVQTEESGTVLVHAWLCMHMFALGWRTGVHFAPLACRVRPVCLAY